MKSASIGLAVLGAFTGVIAAIYWYRASVGGIHAKVDGRFGGGMATGLEPWMGAIIDAIRKSSRLNRIAALWTAASVLLAAASSLAGAFSN